MEWTTLYSTYRDSSDKSNEYVLRLGCKKLNIADLKQMLAQLNV